MTIPVTNFGKVTVSTGYDAAAVSIELAAGHGSRLPSTFPYPLSWWNSTDYPDPADDPNREIVSVTARTGDTLTVTRGAESSGASTKNTANKTYKMLLGLTKGMWDALSTHSISQSVRGLTVRTHPDADKAASQLLVAADAIVMDDGQEVQTWVNVAVDLTVSGAGGLDTGAAAASAWYSLWAIYDGTNKKALLHRAKDYFLDEAYTSGIDGQHALRDAAARTRLAQGFKVDVAGPCEFVDIQLLRTGTPSGQFWVTIEANNGGVPSGTPLATSDKYDALRLDTAAGRWVRLPFRTPASLSAATQYHLVLYGNFTVSASHYLAWRADTGSAAYGNGAKAAYDGATWTTDTDDDFAFKVYITQNDTAVTLPSGYTQKALIGYARTNTGGALKRFFQRDRTITCGQDGDWYINNTAAVCDLVSLDEWLPPCPALATFMGSSASAIDWRLGHLSVLDVWSSLATLAYNRIAVTLPAANFLGYCGPIFIEYEGLMLDNANAVTPFWVKDFTW